MGFTTDFDGSLEITHPDGKSLTAAQVAYLRAFNESRRMKRDPTIAAMLPDPVREAAGLPIGDEGGYYVGSAADGNDGQNEDDSITDYNHPPAGQPGLWCQWTVTEDGSAVEWDEGEKFYRYVDWLKYLITHFFVPWGFVLNGEILWYGEDRDDEGKIVVANNKVTTKHVVKTYE